MSFLNHPQIFPAISTSPFGAPYRSAAHGAARGAASDRRRMAPLASEQQKCGVIWTHSRADLQKTNIPAQGQKTSAQIDQPIAAGNPKESSPPPCRSPIVFHRQDRRAIACAPQPNAIQRCQKLRPRHQTRTDTWQWAAAPDLPRHAPGPNKTPDVGSARPNMPDKTPRATNPQYPPKHRNPRGSRNPPRSKRDRIRTAIVQIFPQQWA